MPWQQLLCHLNILLNNWETLIKCKSHLLPKDIIVSREILVPLFESWAEWAFLFVSFFIMFERADSVFGRHFKTMGKMNLSLARAQLTVNVVKDKI